MARKRKRPAAKLTIAQQEACIDHICTLLCRRVKKGQIKTIIHEQYGINWRQIENYLARARASIARLSSLPKSDHLERAVQFYESIISDENLEPAQRIKAQRYMADLMGIGDHDLAALEARLTEARRVIEELRNVGNNRPPESPTPPRD